MPAELVTIFSDSERRRRVRFSSGVTAPVGVSNVIMRNPQVGSGHPPHLLSVMMYADQFREP
jgi:hypothetical protein